MGLLFYLLPLRVNPPFKYKVYYLTSANNNAVQHTMKTNHWRTERGCGGNDFI
jgi:hypothetical protein